jgi:dolichol-phosphate mannosyltransferase
MKYLSIIIPTYNEELNIKELIKRIHSSMTKNKVKYEIVIIDDFSEDRTLDIVRQLNGRYPIKICLKKGAKGKAQSLLEGFSKAKYSSVAMIDADLQYPPELLYEMLVGIEQYDIMVADRVVQNIKWYRKLLSRIYAKVFGKILLDLPYDIQSGMKVFKKKILKDVDLNPTPWGFDYEFLYEAKNQGYKISQTPIQFDDRKNGKSNITLWSNFELLFGILKLKFKIFLK